MASASARSARRTAVCSSARRSSCATCPRSSACSVSASCRLSVSRSAISRARASAAATAASCALACTAASSARRSASACSPSGAACAPGRSRAARGARWPRPVPAPPPPARGCAPGPSRIGYATHRAAARAPRPGVLPPRRKHPAVSERAGNRRSHATCRAGGEDESIASLLSVTGLRITEALNLDAPGRLWVGDAPISGSRWWISCSHRPTWSRRLLF